MEKKYGIVYTPERTVIVDREYHWEYPDFIIRRNGHILQAYGNIEDIIGTELQLAYLVIATDSKFESIPQFPPITETCSVCEGKGKTNPHGPCPLCDGDGVVPVRRELQNYNKFSETHMVEAMQLAFLQGYDLAKNISKKTSADFIRDYINDLLERPTAVILETEIISDPNNHGSGEVFHNNKKEVPVLDEKGFVNVIKWIYGKE